MNLARYQKKKIAILGFGKEGRALLDFFSAAHISVQVYKHPTEKDFVELSKFQVVFRSPGLPWNSKLIQKLIRKGVEVSSSTKLFFELCPGKIIGITGTKGKGTTATILYKILKTAGKKVFLGGNIGTSPLNFIHKIKKSDLVVLELSSFQLQDLKTSPWLAIMLDVTSDHLDHHKNQAEYISAKSPLIRYQKTSDSAVLDYDSPVVHRLGGSTKSIKHWYSRTKALPGGAFIGDDRVFFVHRRKQEVLFEKSLLKSPGEHYVTDATAAALAAKVLKIRNSAIREGIATFHQSPHRLEFVAEYRGRKFYNDSAATLPDATIAAIESFPGPKILILGGSDKKADYKILVKVIMKSDVRAVITMGETGKKIAKLLHGSKGAPDTVYVEKGIDTVVKKAFEMSREGDTVLLSPASASFGQFDNYQDRGEKFAKAVKKL